MNLYTWFTLMLVISAVWLIWFLYRPLQGNQLDLEDSNIALGKQKQAELKQDLQRNLIDETVYEQAKEEIAQVLAVEMTQTATTIDTQKAIPMWFTVLILVFLMGASLGVYQSLTAQSITAQSATTAQTLAQSILRIKQRTVEQPDDAEAWQILGLALFEANDIDESLKAYERAYQLDAKNITIVVEYASTLAVSQDNQFTGRVSTLVREALEINENAPDALYLAGWVAVNAQQFKLAQKLWQRALSLLPEGQPDRAILQQMLGRLAQVQTDKSGVSSTSKSATPTTQGESASQHQVTINIALSAHLQQAEFSNHYLMVYVKAARGRPMPIAIQKIRVKDFTGVITLTDVNSVMPTQQLSQASKVLAVARLSKSGSAMRQAGDIEAVSQILNVKNNPTVDLALTLDQK